MATDGYTIRSFPKRRKLVTDIGWLSRSRHPMQGIIEVDVTEPRSIIRKIRRESGKQLSFTAFIVATVARAMERTKEVNASHARFGRIAYFDDVNVLTMIEVANTDGMRIPIGHLVPKANKLSPIEIEMIFESFRNTYNSADETKKLDAITSLPKVLRRSLFGQMPRDPRFIQSTMGTVVISAVGMFMPRHAAWALGRANHTVSVWLGSTVDRVCNIKGKLETRTMACITIDLDHDIIDGAPAARFVADVVEMIENAAILKDTRAE
jgi:pyruvate/2-oxoglutarate dehydrogenase complex dihydrolipoamide acyltransferase (E2) component